MMASKEVATANADNTSVLEKIFGGESVQLLCEIIGATNLVHPNEKHVAKKLNTFVMAKLRGVDGKTDLLRKTKKLNENNNPIWTVEHRCLFLLEATKDRLNNGTNKESSRLRLEVRHRDSIKASSCTLLGFVEISMERILQKCNEERIELKLQNESDSKQRSTIAIRFRIASLVDLEYMEVLEDKWKDYSKLLHHNHFDDDDEYHSDHLITESSEKYLAYRGVMDRLSKSFRNKINDENGNVKTMVMPFADPERPSDTKYMTHQDMEEEVLKPSRNWIECGRSTSESLGTLYLEVLRCDGLPNMDTGEAIGNKTDAFICAMFENSLVQTDVIDDKLSPMWLPWTQRAFIFHIGHTLSPLFLSAMDYDLGLGGHDGIGRLAINLNHFQSDMVYTLQYALYPASNIPEREMLGTVTIRLRKTIKDHKQLMMTALKPVPRFNVNMRSHKTLSVANYTSFGKHNEENYDIKLLRSYVNEMLEMKRFFFYALGDAISSLTHWRGQVRFGETYLPLHSAVAFFSGIFLVERPHLLPGFFFLAIAWIMIANMNVRSHHPSPWNRALTFTYYFSILMRGTPPLSTTRIEKYEGHEEASKYEANWKNRIEADLNAANKAWELQEEMDKVGNEDMHTAEEKIEHDPVAIAMNSLASRLFPMQKRLRGIYHFDEHLHVVRYCETMRKMRLILVWQENILSFWVTFGSLVIGFTLLILPTTFIIQWACRLMIWICLGPWMRIYEEFLAPGERDPLMLSDEEARSRYAETMFAKVANQFKDRLDEARLNGEEAVKLKAMRVLRFGRYISKVPSVNITRHYDYPLCESSALHSHLTNSSADMFKSKIVHVPSQALSGSMIQYTQKQQHESSRERQSFEPNAKDVFDTSSQKCSHVGSISPSVHHEKLNHSDVQSVHNDEMEPLIQTKQVESKDEQSLLVHKAKVSNTNVDPTSNAKVEQESEDQREPSAAEVTYQDDRDECEYDNIEVTLSSSLYTTHEL